MPPRIKYILLILRAKHAVLKKIITSYPAVECCHNGRHLILEEACIGNLAVLLSGLIKEDHCVVIIQVFGDISSLVILGQPSCGAVALQNHNLKMSAERSVEGGVLKQAGCV